MQQQVRHRHQASFKGFRYDFGDVGLLQFIELRVVLGAHQHRHIRAQLAYGLQDTEFDIGLRERNDEGGAVLEPHRLENFSVRAIAVHHRITGFAGLAHAARVHIERNGFEAPLLRYKREILNSRMPTASRLCVRLRSAWSASCRKTMAVDDMASAPPMTTSGGVPRTPMATTIIVVISKPQGSRWEHGNAIRGTGKSATVCYDRRMPAATASTTLLAMENGADGMTLGLKGDWRLDNAAAIASALAEVGAAESQRMTVDFAGLTAIDLPGAWLLRQHLDALQARGVVVDMAAPVPEPFAFIAEITRETPVPVASEGQGLPLLARTVAAIGRESVEQVKDARGALGYLGRIVHTGVQALGSVKRLRLPAIVRQVYETGIAAVPIVSLIAFLISVIVAYLGADQLRQFGADIYTVDLVAVAVLRELGVLLTAIIVAGRSGSAFAAEIGVMKLNDEVDALKSIGVNPLEVLVLPRLIGLVIAMPLLTIIADLMGLAGGAMLSSLLLDIPFSQFLQRMQEILAPTTFWAGLVKAPVFALLIGMVGTYRGMQVRDSSRELGRLTTVAVVQSIFLVILADAIFAVVFVEIDF